MRKTLAWLGCVVGVLVAPAARGEVVGDLEISVRYRATGGADMPGLTLTAAKALNGVRVSIERIDGETKVFKVGSMKEGESRDLRVTQEPGRAYYKAEIMYAGLKAPSVLTWSSAVARAFDLSVRGEDVDLDAGRIAMRVTGDAQRLELVMQGEDGAPLLRREVRMDLPSGRPESLTFPPPTVRVGRVEVTAYDENGFTRSVEFTPILIEVPHDEVTFEFDRSDILPVEEPKLDRALVAVHDALDRLGKQIRLRLYVGGYTDTVGSREYNQGLSEARAAALATWLKAHGLRVPVCSQGFGEDVLAVDTPDETREANNRRSLFVLAGQSLMTKQFPRGNWKCH